jgi:hypothetical protein
VSVQLLPESGGPIAKTFTAPAMSRFTIGVTA